MLTRQVRNLIAIDEQLGRWRQRHATLVMRMIGSKSGTGGSSGHAYLNAVISKSRIFLDLCQASHYLLPSHAMPPLPPDVKRRVTRGTGAGAWLACSDDSDSGCPGGGGRSPGQSWSQGVRHRSNSLY